MICLKGVRLKLRVLGRDDLGEVVAVESREEVTAGLGEGTLGTKHAPNPLQVRESQGSKWESSHHFDDTLGLSLSL